MNKKTLTLLVAAAFAAPTLASAKDFTGFGAAVELQLKSTGSQYTESFTEPGVYSDSSSEDLGGKQDVIGAVNLWYGFNVTPTVVLQIGGTYDLGKTEAGGYAYSDTDGDWESFEVKESNHYSLYLAPGYRVTPKTLVYGKIAYHSMKLKESYSDSSGGSDSSSESFRGLGLGAGVSTMLTNNIFLYAEAQHVMYKEKTVFSATFGSGTYSEKVKPTSTIGSIGIGYNF